MYFYIPVHTYNPKRKLAKPREERNQMEKVLVLQIRFAPHIHDRKQLQSEINFFFRDPVPRRRKKKSILSRGKKKRKYRSPNKIIIPSINPEDFFFFLYNNKKKKLR